MTDGRSPATAGSKLDEVQKFVVRLSPDPVCDDCITEKLNMGAEQPATLTVRELAGTSGFERSKGVCGLCGSEKLVIRKL